MRAAVENNTAELLTLEAAKQLKGKKIETIYFGYRGQDGVDEFVVGDLVKKEWIEGYDPFVLEMFTADGRGTNIRAHSINGYEVFSCSDSDRYVYFIEIEGNYHIQHNTKGFYAGNGNWITRNWQNAKSYPTIEAAEREAKTLKALDGKLLKKLQIISFYKKEEHIHFPSFKLHKEISNEN